MSAAGRPQGARVRRSPRRTCIACGRKADKSSLTRLVASGKGIQVDPSGKMHGRGAYLCLGSDCDPTPLRARRLSYALRTTISEKEAARLISELSGRAPGEGHSHETNDKQDRT